MTTLRNITLSLSINELDGLPSLRCQGLLRPKMKQLLPQVFEDIQQQNIFEPALCYSLNSIDFCNGYWAKAQLAAHRLRGASQVAIGFVTLGPKIADHIQFFFNQGEQLKALITEGIANYALFKLQDIFLEMITQEATRLGNKASGILNPGEEGLDLSLQEVLLPLAGGHDLDLKLTTAGMINPRHSLSALIGIGPKMKQWTQVENCSSCAANDRCIYQEKQA